MGLDTTHGCWHGAYSAFTRWRQKLAEVAGIPLDLMENYWPYPHEPSLVNSALEWAAPRNGGPLCHDPNGPILHRYIEDVNRWLPIKWESLRPDILHVLLNHSDCEGAIETADCAPLAERLADLLPLLPDGDGGGHIGPWREKTQQFIDGLRLAAEAGEDVEFH